MSGTSTLVRTEPGEPPARRSRRWGRVALGAVAILVWLVVGGIGGTYQGKLAQVQKNDNSAYLPASAESSRASNQADAFSRNSIVPGNIVFQRNGGLTPSDRAFVVSARGRLAAISGVAADQVGLPLFSQDATAASIAVPLVAASGGHSASGEQLSSTEQQVVATARSGAPVGLAVHSAGPAGILVAFVDSFAGIDSKLLVIAGVVVILLLLAVYRSPVMWFFPLFSSVLALGVSSLAVYFLAKHNVITLSGQSQGILSVLVIGAGTDYALLLISRYREELHVHASRFAAMWAAWRGAMPAIVASAATVILGLLSLLFGSLKADSGLGPVAAIGIACTVAVMLTFLPLLVVVAGRWIFWPRIPRPDRSGDLEIHRTWARVAALVGRRDRRAWVVTSLILLAGMALLPTLQLGRLPNTAQFTNRPDAVVGQQIYDAKFPAGAGAPAVIVVNATAVNAVVAAVRAVPGMATGPGAVCLQPDYAKVAAAVNAGQRIQRAANGCLPTQFLVQPRAGRTVIDAQLAAAYDSSQAATTVQQLRAAVHAVPEADALVGGATTANLDVADAATRDRNVIIAIALLVIFAVLALLLRALVAPVLLIITVVLSFLATLGISGFVFSQVFGFAKADNSFVLYSFVFLVSLGIDYNIFLMTRIREETLKSGTRTGTLRGLAVTGGVITSAGVVLAATFAVLGVLPLVALAEIGFTVAFGVLLDTFVVRSILVPALAHDLGKRIWWPSRLSQTAD